MRFVVQGAREAKYFAELHDAKHFLDCSDYARVVRMEDGVPMTMPRTRMTPAEERRLFVLLDRGH